MIRLFVVLALGSAMGQAYAKEKEIKFVNSVQISESGTVLKINYNTGGCGPQGNKPVIRLEHVSTKDITPEWAIKEDPKTLREYSLVFQAKVVETGDGGLCRMGYDITVEGDIRELFKKVAPSLKIDLNAKKAHYGISVLGPQVRSHTMFSAFDE